MELGIGGWVGKFLRGMEWGLGIFIRSLEFWGVCFLLGFLKE